MNATTTQDRLDEIATEAQSGVRSGQRYAQQAVDRVTERASELASQSLDWMRDRGDKVRDGVARASDRTVGYVRDEPARSMLMAAAAGAVVFALISMVAGRSKRGRTGF